MQEPQVRINPETGQPEEAVFQPVNEAEIEAAVNEAQNRFTEADQAVEQLNQVVQNTRAALEQSEAELKVKVEDKDAADLALQAAKSRQDAIARARELHAQVSQPSESEGAGEDSGEPTEPAEPVKIPVVAEDGVEQPA